MATVSLFWDTNMATVTSCENTLYPKFVLRDLSEISRGGGEGVETEGGSQLFETAEKGGVMQICVRDHVEVHPQKKREVLYFVKKTWEK